MIKRYRKNKLNGSVLYTVVAVMMIMTVFIFAALSLASAANRRAFNSYANNQTQYTARSVVDSMMKILRENGEKAVGSVDCDLLNASLDSSMGKVTSAEIIALDTIENLEKAGYNFGLNLTKEQKKNYVYKLSATVKMLGQENTVTLYCYNGKEDNPPVFNHSITVLGDLITDNSSRIYGTAVSRLEEIEGAPENIGFSNNTDFNFEYATRANLLLYGNNDWIFPMASSGLYLDGILSFNGGGSTFKSGVTSKNLLYRELPYMYITKDIQMYNNSPKIGTDNAPLIVMADSINSSGSNYIYGDAYLYNPYAESTISNNALKSWNSDVVIKKDHANKLEPRSYMGGNLYSMGSVTVNGSGTLANNVLVQELLTLNGNTNTTGAVVAQNLNINGGDTFNFANGLFVDPDIFSLNYNTSINGKKYSDSSVYEYDQIVYSGDKTVSYSQNEYLELNRTGYNISKDSMPSYIELPFDFSDIIPDDVYDYSVTPTSVKIKWGKTNGAENNIQSMNIFFDFTEDNNTYSSLGSCYANVNDISGELEKTWLPSISSKKGNLIISGSGYTGLYDFYPKLYIEEIEVNYFIKEYNKVTEYYETTPLGIMKAANDVAFNNNGNIIYIDDIDNSVKIEKFVDYYGYTKLKISTADLTGVEEGKELVISYSDVGEYDYDTQYADFLRAVVSTVKFPETMKKDKVLKPNGGFVKDDLLEAKRNELLTQIKNNSKSYEDVKGFIEGKKTYVYDHGQHKIFEYSKGNPVNQISEYDPISITESCTLTGQFNMNGTIKIKPGDNDIYINLINFEAQNLKLIIDDSGKGKVIFIVPRKDVIYDYSFIDSYGAEQNVPIVSKGNVSFDQSIISTQSYYDDLLGAKTEISSNPTEKKYIPNVYFYMDDLGNGTFSVQNAGLITAYINAPTSSFVKGGDGTFTNTELHYDGEKVDNFRNGNIGGAIFKSANLSNPFHFMYVNENGASSGTPDPSDIGDFTTLYYQSY